MTTSSVCAGVLSGCVISVQAGDSNYLETMRATALSYQGDSISQHPSSSSNSNPSSAMAPELQDLEVLEMGQLMISFSHLGPSTL